MTSGCQGSISKKQKRRNPTLLCIEGDWQQLGWLAVEPSSQNISGKGCAVVPAIQKAIVNEALQQSHPLRPSADFLPSARGFRVEMVGINCGHNYKARISCSADVLLVHHKSEV